MHCLVKGNCMSACAGRIYFGDPPSNDASVLKRTDIAPDQLKMINNPAICKIAIYSAQARQPNLRNTAVKTVPGEASAVPVSAWAKRVHREIVQPPGRDDRAGPHFQPVVVLLTRLTTSATFTPKASAVFKSPG